MTFTEVQKFSPIALWFVRLLSIGMIALVLFVPELRKTYIGYFIIFISLSSWALIESVKLSVQIDEDGISMRMRPFTSKNYSWSEIDTAEVIDYGFVGGWGVRKTKSYGTVYNTRGSKGIFIHLKEGKKFVIGVQAEDEAKKVVSYYSSSSPVSH